MLWHILRIWVTPFLSVFYKRIQGKNINYLQVKGPTIIAMNHPNAFTDPVYMSYLAYPEHLYFMARGDAFVPGVISWLLEKIGIVPIFRLKDGGKEGLKKNNESYQKIFKLLKQNKKVIVFAEGLCIQERRLRPLKKGVARMAFDANIDDLKIIPVGINYDKPDKFRSTVFYNVGEPIFIKDYVKDYQDNPVRTQALFLKHLENRLFGLITHIEDKKNDEIVYRVEELWKEDRLREMHLSYKILSSDFIITKEITHKVNHAEENVLEEFREESKNYFEKLKQNKISDWAVNHKRKNLLSIPNILLRFVLLLMGFPFYMIGLVGNFTPLWLTHKLTSKVVKNIEFYSSFAIAFGMVIFLINYILIFSLLYFFQDLPAVIIQLAAFVLCGIISLHYHPFLLKTLQELRLLRNSGLSEELLKEREKVISLINKF